MTNDIVGVKIVTLTEEQIKQCQDFSVKSASSQQRIEFGSKDTNSRSTADIARDNLIGKLAEVAFAHFLFNQFSIQTKLDFDIYPRGKWDSDDFLLSGKPVDIKATRTGGQWLLIELNKLEFRKKENKLPDYFLFAVTGWKKEVRDNRKIEEPTGQVILTGYAALHQICHPKRIGIRTANICEGLQDTIFLPKGGRIPNTQTQLQADNCARHISSLDTNWTRLIQNTSGR